VTIYRRDLRAVFPRHNQCRSLGFLGTFGSYFPPLCPDFLHFGSLEIRDLAKVLRLMFSECSSAKWPFMKYFQIAGLDFGQMGQWMGTFEHGDEDVDSAATL
jgi:hypothetical protein